MVEAIIERYHYAIIFFLMMAGLFIAMDANNLLKRLIGLSVFQTSIFLFYIALGKVAGGVAPILVDDHGSGHAAHDAASVLYSNPLPHVLILTAIVVGAATLSVGLALAARIYQSYGSIRLDTLNAADQP